jgi:hypothetical protein
MSRHGKSANYIPLAEAPRGLGSAASVFAIAKKQPRFREVCFLQCTVRGITVTHFFSHQRSEILVRHLTIACYFKRFRQSADFAVFLLELTF